MMLRILVITTVLGASLFLVTIQAAYAAADSFTVGQTVDTPDAEPPTIPGNFSATPVTADQIDLDWDASSDNIGVDGYQIFRDAAAIATTTLTAYSDTGLTADTQYTYFVRAFDAAGNYSTSTPAIATSTLEAAATSTAPTAGGSAPRIENVDIIDITYDTDTRSIELQFTTNVYTKAVVRWGRDENYSGGYTISEAYRTEHTTRIDELEAGTIYEIEITVNDRSGLRTDSETVTVRTDAGVDAEPPANVSAFSAELIDGQVELSWRNPEDPDFSHVRILSSDRFYPTHTQDGWFVYEGGGEHAIDDRPLPEGAWRFYTVFAYDAAGNVSSGAVARVMRGEPSPDPGEQRPGDTATQTGAFAEPTFTFDDIRFIQDGEEKRPIHGEVAVDSGVPTTIAVAYDRLPEHLKTIVVSLAHPDNAERTFAFLLRVNAEKTAYEATIGALAEPGTYETDAMVFDYAARELFAVSGVMRVHAPPFGAALRSTDDGGMYGILLAAERYLTLLMLLLMLLLVLLYWSVRKWRDGNAREDSPLQFR